MPPETPPVAPAPAPQAAVREVVGLVLLLAGWACVVVSAFLVSPVLGLATIGASALAVGLWLTFEETVEEDDRA